MDDEKHQAFIKVYAHWGMLQKANMRTKKEHSKNDYR
jgi:hypothetical protein